MMFSHKRKYLVMISPILLLEETGFEVVQTNLHISGDPCHFIVTIVFPLVETFFSWENDNIFTN